MKLTPHITPIIILAFLAAIGSACNEKSKEAEDVTDYSNTSVTSFYIKANNKVMENLDSVFFSIDLERGLIFNADSLPKGTDVSRLIPMVTCASGVREVVFDMEGGSYRTGQSNYTLHPADTIDFSGRVTLKVTAADGTNSRLYEVKVNVHRTNPDSLAWGKVALSRLPARLPEPRAQKCVDFGGKPLMLLAEADGSFTLARADAPDGSWSREEVAPGFSPDVRSLTATTDALYILDTDGRLMTSADGRVWTFTGRKWVSLTGAYVDHALGLCAGDNGLEHDIYPASEEFAGGPADAAFPVGGTTMFINITNKWMDRPVGILNGGRAADGSLSSATWGFDGSGWANLTETPPPPLVDATMIPYFMKKRSSALWLYDTYSVLLLIGGKTSSGELSRKTYISYDTGITWEEAPVSLLLPDYIPSFSAADCIVASTRMTENFEPKGWVSAKEPPLPAGARRKSYSIDGYDVTWECPYIYLYGGHGPDGRLHDTVWRGVVNRLTYRPIF